MARAKRTERADARRRYRATQAEVSQFGDDEEPLESSADAPARASARRGTPRLDAPQPTPPRPPTFTAAFRAAARPLNVREDLRLLPQILRHRSVWIPVLLTTIAGGLLIVVGSENQLINIVAQVFVVPPPMAASFLAGLLAPRASYMAGAVAGLWASIVFAVVVFAIPSTDALQVTTSDRVSVAMYGLAVSPLFGLAVGGFAGYYRRFLAVSSPSRRRQEQLRASRGSNRPAARRR